MYNAQGCVWRCERVVKVKTGLADSSRRMWHFPKMRFQRMRNNIRKGLFFCSRSKQHLGQQQYINFDITPLIRSTPTGAHVRMIFPIQ